MPKPNRGCDAKRSLARGVQRACPNRVICPPWVWPATMPIDLLLLWPDGQLAAIEVKRSLTPKADPGFHNACEELQPHRAKGGATTHAVMPMDRVGAAPSAAVGLCRHPEPPASGSRWLRIGVIHAPPPAPANRTTRPVQCTSQIARGSIMLESKPHRERR